jgi:hypothetical protein
VSRELSIRLRRLVVVSLAILGVAAPAAAWDIQWEVSERAGKPRVAGYVKNDSLRAMTNLNMRVDRLAADGAVVSTTRAILVGPIHSGDRLYFDMRVPERAATYRVSVEAYDWYRCGE